MLSIPSSSATFLNNRKSFSTFMDMTESPFEEGLSSPGTDNLTIDISEISTPATQSGETSPTLMAANFLGNGDGAENTQKKKKKKKPKKSAKAKEAAKAKVQEVDAGGRPPVLCISRNKHWRYISSYHGPWLQLPLELLQSLLVLNLDPATLSASEARLPPLLPPPSGLGSGKQRDRGFSSLNDCSPPNSPRKTFTQSLPPLFPSPNPGKATPPPIDPGVFRSVVTIRGLIDEAAELSVRASSGLSAAELGSLRGGSSLNTGSWAAQSLGISPMGTNNGGGRNVAMSSTRIHRLRAIAVQKLAEAYKIDEIASSVMVMQGGSVFDDVAERVLKVDPNNADAKYIHFFHEKIPSRQLAESTSTSVLDELIAAFPQRLEYFRTRGIVHCFRDEFQQATKDFTHALKEARAIRKARMMHRNNNMQSETRTKKKRKGSANSHTNGQAPADGTSSMDNTIEGLDGEPLLLHPSVMADAPDPIEPQLLFHRGAAYLQHAIHLIEGAVLKLEGVSKTVSADGAEMRLCYIENGKYGGIEIGNSDGPLGKKSGTKATAYRSVLGDKAFKDSITSLLKKSLRDHEKFLAHFDSLESPTNGSQGDLAHRIEYAFLLSESIRPGNHNNMPPPVSNTPAMFTTYHPLLVESHFSVLICQTMLADFKAILPTFARTACLVDGLEGYPVFLPPRSMGQAEFIEVLERLAGGWRIGAYPHSLSTYRGKSRLAIEGPPTPTRHNLHNGRASVTGSGSSSAPSKNGGSSGSSPAEDNEDHHQDFVRPDAAEALDCLRILLAPVVRRQRERAERVAAEKNGLGNSKPTPINIPLHGPRVEVILAWLAAVHLPELET